MLQFLYHSIYVICLTFLICYYIFYNIIIYYMPPDIFYILYSIFYTLYFTFYSFILHSIFYYLSCALNYVFCTIYQTGLGPHTKLGVLEVRSDAPERGRLRFNPRPAILCLLQSKPPKGYCLRDLVRPSKLLLAKRSL